MLIPIQDPEDPHASLYDVDDENTIITLADWWHTPAIAVCKPFFHILPSLSNCSGHRSLSLHR